MIILGTNSIKDTGFDVANSLRFNDGSTDNLSRTKGTSDSTTKGTYSFWFKLSKTTGLTLIENGTAAADRAIVYIASDSTLKIFSKIGNSTKLDLNPNRVFRDTSAWYHLVIAIDTTDGTAGDRVKVYVNGVRETSFATATYPDQNDALRFFTSSEIEEIGIDFENGGLFDGYMCEVVKVDGSQLAPTSFGEFDEDSGIWKPIDVSGLTFGTNGFYLDFEDSSALGNDAAGSNNFTVNNLTAIDQSTDTCTNNFATWNNLIKTTATFSEGNLKYAQPGSNPVFGSLSTIGVTSGKWYAELNYTSGSSHKLVLGVADETFQNGNTTASYDLGKSGTTSSIAYVVNTGDYRVNNSNTSWGSGGGDGDIINMAIDRDNNKIYFGVNGTWGNSSNPASNSGGIPTTALDSSTNWFWGITSDTSGTSDVGELNFGSPSYSESGGETDGNGYGNFAHEPPSGYYSLNTKNLAEYG
jgi:hypothetical protein